MVLSSMQPDAVRRRISRSKPDGVLRHRLVRYTVTLLFLATAAHGLRLFMRVSTEIIPVDTPAHIDTHDAADAA